MLVYIREGREGVFWEFVAVELIIMWPLYGSTHDFPIKKQVEIIRWNVLNFIAYLSAPTPTRQKYSYQKWNTAKQESSNGDGDGCSKNSSTIIIIKIFI